LRSSHKQALKARFNPGDGMTLMMIELAPEVNRAFSAGILFNPTNPGTLPQAEN
jgi:hypothetical protein